MTLQASIDAGVTRLDCGGRALDLGRVGVMGVLNVTPDSFSDGGLFLARDRAVNHAIRMVAEGAAIIDIGGESTRPGARGVSVQEELDRVIALIEALQQAIAVPISIDTSKPEVMRAAVAAGAGMINDVRALRAPEALQTAAQLGVPVCLMHMQGEPRTMQEDPRYDDVVQEVKEFLRLRSQACRDAGIHAANIIVDPGFGFGKTLEHNLELLRNLGELATLGTPVLVGLSRKSMIAKVLDLPLERRMIASVALAVVAVQNGANLVRAHDVGATCEAVRMAEAVYRAG
ncbi:MAG: dihydropteroate synthase [Acidiferrobacterales bacterium]